MNWISSILKSITGVAGKYLDSDVKKKEFETEIRGMLNSIDLAQIGVNLEEAKSESLWKSGWRPFAGWVSVTALALNMLIFPLVSLLGIKTPVLDMEMVIYILGGLLGIGTFRTVEKLKGKV